MTGPREARHLRDELDSLRSQLLEMAGLAEDLVEMAVAALVSKNQEKADAVILGDRELDAMEVELEDASISLLALHQPVARDLRLITMVMRISNDLERVGDHAVNIAESVRHLDAKPPLDRFPQVEEMARIAQGMLADSLDAFVRGDPELARAVCLRDDRVDGLNDSLFRSLLTHMMEDHRRIGTAMSLILVGRNLERVADLATNVGEDVYYLVTGTSIKHAKKLGEG